MSADGPLHWPLATAYLELAAEGRLVVPECADCGESHFPPRALCPYCLSSSIDVRESVGTGAVYAFTVVHVEYHPYWGERTPYLNALVDLDDGPIVFGNVVDCNPDDVAVGDQVSMTFETVDGQVLPMFTPE